MAGRNSGLSSLISAYFSTRRTRCVLSIATDWIIICLEIIYYVDNNIIFNNISSITTVNITVYCMCSMALCICSVLFVVTLKAFDSNSCISQVGELSLYMKITIPSYSFLALFFLMKKGDSWLLNNNINFILIHSLQN